ncbi:MAG: 2-amino-4-hydroxy-6-hydroxymethyldihydropteridine diphosphokinase [Acidobacteria bacterium]|nr:2-amino-4-hydroxy-6-hydroxymethyldihydropteridine diphosphokinase [Acidobacteriota bacterium]
MRQAFILAGTNLGDRKANLDFALNALEQGCTIKRASSCFETEPVGFLDQPWFYNQAIEFETRLSPSELLSLCQNIEFSRGRIRTFPNAPRFLDLDILFFGNLILEQENLIIPHPRIQERRFVLEPLAEIAPDFVHPVLKKTIRSLLETCLDKSRVRLASCPQNSDK